MSLAIPPSADQPAPRVGVVIPYWSFWEPSAGTIDLRADREATGRRVAGVLKQAGLRPVSTALVDSAESGAAAARQLRQAGVDALLAVSTMAAPPTHLLAALRALDDVPLVIWTVQRGGQKSSMSDIVVDGGTVGTPMVTNVLARLGRPFGLVVGPVDQPGAQAEVVGCLRAAALARRLHGARVARVGEPIAGYLCVDADDEALADALGVAVMRLHPTALRDAYLEVTDAQTAALREKLTPAFRPEGDLDATGSLDRSLRLVCALRSLGEGLGLVAGTVNCHVPELRFADDPGITPCLALGEETTRGIPWTCTGDVITAIAMLVAKRLSGAALYHEIESIDPATGECLLANSGEHDRAWAASDQRPWLRANPWFERDARCGTCAWFNLPASAATLIAFTPHAGGFRFIAAEGEITGRRLDASPTVGGAFRFGLGTAAWRRWVEAGANHHSALARGHIVEAVRLLSRLLGVGFVQV